MRTKVTKTVWTCGLALTVLLIGAVAWADELFTAEGLRFAMPKDHEPGAESYTPMPSRNGSEHHYRGEDCSRCHMEGGKATNYPFTMAGTIYADFAGTTPVEGAEIILEDAHGTTVSMLSNAEGNFFTSAPLAGSVYKSWVQYEDRVVPMVTVPSIGTVGSWMSCNMHHFPDSPRGALFIPTGTTLRDYPDRDVSFEQHVKPILLQQCRPCHVPAESNPVASQLLGDERITYDFSGGLDLTTYAGIAAARADKPELVNEDEPDQSTLLTEVLVQPAAEHAGGRYWKTTDPDYQVIRLWIAEGARE